MNPFTFSIVTPSFNKGAFIEETIRSDLSQESDFYIDYIVMDGGYTDSSMEVYKYTTGCIKRTGCLSLRKYQKNMAMIQESKHETEV
jgi:hypothetical protein